MLKHLSITAMLLGLAAGAANAQQREAVLHKVEMPGVAFDLVVATPRPGGVVYDLAESPDALLLPLSGGELALGFEQPEALLKALELVQAPGTAFVHTVSGSRTPVAIYLVPKAD